MISTNIIYAAAFIAMTIIAVQMFVRCLYRRGRQVEFRVSRGTGTGEVIGISGLRLRVRSLSSGNEHTVSLTNVRRR